MKRVLAWASLLACSCGLQPVELWTAPPGAAEGGQDVVVGAVPSAAIERLRAAPDDGPEDGLELLYPRPPALVIPANLAPIAFEWQGMGGPMPPAPPMKPMAAMPAPPPAPAEPMGTLVYELLATVDGAEARLYTLASTGTLPLERWRSLLRAGAGNTLHVRVRALRVESGDILRAKPLDIEVRAALPAGDVYSWSTTAQRLGRASLDSSRESYPELPAPLLSSNASPCLGCHVVARDGKRILAAVGGEQTLWSWSPASLDGQAVSRGDGADTSYVFGSFDPTAARIAVTRAGRLLILDAQSGALLQNMGWPMALTLDYPDWSPDGRSIVVVTSAMPMKGHAAAMGSTLARVSVALDGSLGDLTPLDVGMMMPDETPMFPTYTPDSDWIIFAKRRGPERREGSLFIAPASGGAAIELATATGGSYPGGLTGAPSILPGDLPDRLYVLFSSRRAVGSYVPAEGQRQLFATALDLPLAAAGKDPSHAPFWLPFQQRSSSYLRGYWAPAISSCSPAPEVCDGSDDDCDSRIDEDCCTPEPDVCGDQNDNDCDGVVDEGCSCTFQELCANGTDDDCDLQVDEAPCMPAPGGTK